MPPKKVSKTALLIILDCGPDSAVTTSKDGETFFSRAKKCVLRIFEQKIFEGSTDEIAVVLMGPATRNALYDQMEGEAKKCYGNLAEEIELKMASWESVRRLDRNVQLCDKQADWISALVVGLDVLHRSYESRFYDKMKIVLMTTFASSISAVSDDIKSQIIKKMKGEGSQEMGPVELIVINDNVEYDDAYDVNCDTAHFSQQIGKDDKQRDSEKLICDIVKEVDGVLCNLENAEMQIVYFEKKRVGGRPTQYTFKIGSHISIEVSEYVKVESVPKFLNPWKLMHSITEEDVKKEVKYYKNDEEIKAIPEMKRTVLLESSSASENQQSEVKRTEINQNTRINTSGNQQSDPMGIKTVEVINGFMYGSTPVPFTFNLKQNFGEKGLDCIGFSDRKYLLSEYMSAKGCHIILPQMKYKSSPQKFAALVQALAELNFVIIARKMYNKNSDPKIVAMIPDYEDGKPFFTEIGLHFKEDCIDIKFPSLRNTTKYKPTEEQYNIMEQLINSMDLMTAGNEKSGNAEAFALNKTLNPVNQHVCRMIAHRALHPNEPTQQISDELTELIDVPKKIKEMSRETLLKAKELFVLEEVKKPSKMQMLQARLKQIDEKAADSTEMSENAIEQNLPVDTQIERVGTVTPAEDFLFLYSTGILDFVTLTKQLQEVIIKITFQAFTVPRVKIAKALLAYRDTAKDSRPDNYNQWIVKYKDELLTKDKEELFKQVIVDEQLGLIVSSETNLSGVSPQRGEEFYRTDRAVVKTIVVAPTNDEDDDVMDLIE